MKKGMLILCIIIFIGCTTTQRNYIKNSEPIDSIYLEASGLGGFIIGVLSASLVYTIYDNVME